jgi:3-oxoacyl-[acyl-carrier protein] reductase
MISLNLSQKRALVCGSTQGIGKAIAIAFAEAGASVILAARNEAALQRTLAELPQTPNVHHSYICADFSRKQDVEQALDAFLKKEGNPPIHILVNNTGGPAPGAIAEASAESFIAAFTQHIVVSQMLVQRLLSGMKQEQYGRIINIISTSVKQPIPNLGVSNTTRGAMASWAKTLSFELAPHGITVNNILPGYIKTGRLESLTESIAKGQNKSIDEVATSLLQTIPAGRFGEPSELGHLATFLASPIAGYITGTSIQVDGGRTSAL